MYIQSIQVAINYIEQNLKETLNLAAIAKSAGYSMYHFDRVFKLTLGETVMEYVRKRKLSEAAKELIETDHRIIDIAVEYGFQSQRAFTSSFSKYYGTSPGRYRRNGKNIELLAKYKLTPELIERTCETLKNEPKLIRKESFMVVGMEYFGSNNHGEIPSLWQAFIGKMSEIEKAKYPSITMGICDHVDGYDPEKSEFSYMACMEVEDGSTIPEGMILKHIPEGYYVVFTHRGSANNLEETYRYIYSTYFFKSNYELAQAPDFELYDNRFRPGEDESEMDIYIPVIITEESCVIE